MRTRLCDILGIEHPILNAPMAGGAGAELAAAVSAAGGFGLIGASLRSRDDLRDEIRRAHDLTDRPFGVGFISHAFDPAGLSAVAFDEGVAAVAHSFADPTPFVADAHAAGVLVLAQVRTVAEARVAANAGVDVVTAQGTEAGGHTGMVSTLPLVPAVVDAVSPIPVVAAGGIADARGIAAALMLGAEGVWLGTRFVSTPEFHSEREGWRERLVAASTDDTVFNDVFDIAIGVSFPENIHARTLRNPFTDRWADHEGDLRAWDQQQHRDYFENGWLTPDDGPLYAGEGVGLIDAIEPAGSVVQRLARETDAHLRERLGVLGA